MGSPPNQAFITVSSTGRINRLKVEKSSLLESDEHRMDSFCFVIHQLHSVSDLKCSGIDSLPSQYVRDRAGFFSGHLVTFSPPDSGLSSTNGEVREFLWAKFNDREAKIRKAKDVDDVADLREVVFHHFAFPKDTGAISFLSPPPEPTHAF